MEFAAVDEEPRLERFGCPDLQSREVTELGFEPGTSDF